MNKQEVVERICRQMHGGIDQDDVAEVLAALRPGDIVNEEKLLGVCIMVEGWLVDMATKEKAARHAAEAAREACAALAISWPEISSDEYPTHGQEIAAAIRALDLTEIINDK